MALAGWIVPGLGYVLIGERGRGLIAGVTILLTFVFGLLIGGIRVVDVPGYDTYGNATTVNIGGAPVWTVRARFTNEVLNKPWYMAQTLVGPVNFAATWGSLQTAQAKDPDTGEQLHRQSTARIADIGTLYTAVAGMLNLLVIIDAAYRSTKPPGAGATAPKSNSPAPTLSTSAEVKA